MLLYGADKEVSDWVSVELFGVEGQLDNSRAIGIVHENRLIAGIVYNNQQTDGNGVPYQIEMSIASIDKHWATRHNLKALFDYPFTGLQVRRVQTHCSSQDEEVIMFNQRLGFTHEGTHTEGWPLGGDSLSWGMLKHNCKWIKNG